jgi:hypothetical protein
MSGFLGDVRLSGGFAGDVLDIRTNPVAVEHVRVSETAGSILSRDDGIMQRRP